MVCQVWIVAENKKYELNKLRIETDGSVQKWKDGLSTFKSFALGFARLFFPIKSVAGAIVANNSSPSNNPSLTIANSTLKNE
jgi:hypothetical protein